MLMGTNGNIKKILIKDLCSRLPYGVKGQAKGMIKFFADEEVSEEPWTLTSINVQLNTFGADTQTGIPLFNRRTGICNFKQYLFPMSSMTEEQNDSWRDAWFPDLMSSTDINYPESEKYLALSHYKSMDWLYKHHFDINGLIEKGLAIDATGLNIY